jgi:hypothetical protein
MTGAQTTTGFSCNIDLNNYNNATDATYTVGRISGVRTSSVNNGQLRFYTNVNNTLTEVARMDESRLTTFYGDLSGNVANDVRASFTRINALTEFQRDGVKGSIFTPMVEGTVDLTDTNGTPWNGTNNFAVGTYTFDVNSTSNPNNGGVPAEATAVVLLVSGNWTTASQNSFALVLHRTGSPLAPTGDGKAAFQLRAINGGFNTDVQGVVPLDANGQFSIKVAGAEMKAASCRLIGYYI